MPKIASESDRILSELMENTWNKNIKCPDNEDNDQSIINRRNKRSHTVCSSNKKSLALLLVELRDVVLFD